ncbi:MAG: hypothetical protein M3Y54_01430 [Bacteroidota bacterium]|nr:hypothetical protein [Bacteroidota bacterium]
MRIALAVFLNAALLALLLSWLRRQWAWAGSFGWRGVLGLGLLLRVGTGLARSLPLRLDAEYMHDFSQLVTARLRAAPGRGWQVLTQAVTVFPTSHSGDIVYQNSSNTWFMIKLLALLNLASLGTGWLNALYLSLFAFAGCWVLARALARHLPATPAGAGVVALLLWPSVWFWASGISKEAVLLGSGAWLTARVITRLYGTAPAYATGPAAVGSWWLGTLLLAMLHLATRYFFAIPLLAVLAGLALGRGLERLALGRRWAAVGGLVLVMGAGGWLAPQVSVAFRVNKLLNQVVRIYSSEIRNNMGQPHFEYPDLRPTLGSLVAHAPQAVANCLARPWLGETRQPVFVAVGIENAALLLLLLAATVALLRGRGGRLPFGLGLGLGLLCLLLAFLIGLTTPNLGSLHRYRTELLPFLLLLLLQPAYAAQALRRLGLAGRGSPEAALPPPEA